MIYCSRIRWRRHRFDAVDITRGERLSYCWHGVFWGSFGKIGTSVLRRLNGTYQGFNVTGVGTPKKNVWPPPLFMGGLAHSLQRVVCGKAFASIFKLDICCATLHTKGRVSKKKQPYGTVGGWGGLEILLSRPVGVQNLADWGSVIFNVVILEDVIWVFFTLGRYLGLSNDQPLRSLRLI